MLRHSVCLFVCGSAELVSVLKEALGDSVLPSHEGEIFQAPVRTGNVKTMEKDRVIAKQNQLNSGDDPRCRSSGEIERKRESERSWSFIFFLP